MAARKKTDVSEAALQATLDRIRAKFGMTAAVIPGITPARSEVKEVIPTGIDVLDHYILGCGGLPVGRSSEIFCDEGGGKTTLTWTALASHTNRGGAGIYCDNEQSFDAKRCAKLGMNPKKMILLQPWTLEEALEQMHFTMEEGLKGLPRPVLVAWDSVAESAYKGDLTGNYNKEAADDRSKKLGKFCRAMAPVLPSERVHLLIVNQTREMRGVMFGSKTTTPGGKAIKFFASHRLQLFPGKSLKNAVGQHVGKNITMIAVKNRFAPPWRKAKVRLDFEHGWDNCWSTINLAKDLSLIPAALKVTEETYDRAVKAFGWPNPAPWKTTEAAAAEEEGSTPEEKELDEWVEGTKGKGDTKEDDEGDGP